MITKRILRIVCVIYVITVSFKWDLYLSIVETSPIKPLPEMEICACREGILIIT